VTGVHVFDAPADLAREAARQVAGRIAAQSPGRPFRLGLSGGRTPVELYRNLARTSLDWDGVELFFADERAVSPTDPESNYWMVRKVLIEPAGITPGRVHRMRAEQEDLEAAAREYEPQLAEPLDLLILGVGEDGHVASLFPGSPLLVERRRRVAPVLDSPKPPPRRLTVTPLAFEESREVMVLAIGAAKSRAVALALEGEVEPDAFPARLVRDREWYVDAAAGSVLQARD